MPIQRDQLVQQLQGLSDEDMAQFSDQELSRIEAILGSQQPDVSELTNPMSEQAMQSVGTGVFPFATPQPEAGRPPSGELQAVGGALGGLAAAQRAQTALAPTPPLVRGVGTIAAGALGAFGGGLVGGATEQGIKSLADLPDAPKSFSEAFLNTLQAGGEEAAWDAGLNTLFLGGGAVIRGLRPQASELANSIRRVLEGGGSGASLGQLTDNAVFKGMEQLTRGALVGGQPFTRLNLAQDKAIVNFTDDYIKTFSDVADNELTDVALGRVFLDTVKKGRGAHSAAAGELYRAVDEAAQGILINTSTIRGPAERRLAQLERTGNVGRTREGGQILEDITSISPEVSFSDLQVIRSDLLSRKRALDAADKADPVVKNISETLSEIDRVLDSASQAGDLPDAAVKALREANRFWKFGKDNFNNRLISSLVKKEDVASKIAPSLFKSGNREEILAARRAIKSASIVDPSIDFNKTWGQMQAGYLRSLAPDTIDEVATSQLRKLHKDPKAKKTLASVFTREQQKGITEVSQAIDEILKRRQGTTGLLNLRQIGGAAQLFAGGASLQNGVGLGEATAILGIPALFAAVAANPRSARAWVRWAKAKPGTALKATALTRLAAELGLSVGDIDPTNETQLGVLNP